MYREYDGPDETEDDIAKGRLEYELAAIRLSEELLPLVQKEQSAPKQKWSKHDELYLDRAIASCMHLGNIDTADWLKSLKDKCLPQPKQEWSEEDELRMENILSVIEGYGYPMEVEWLKSLKGRVQPKQEWDEEDEKILSDIIKDLVHPWNEYIPNRIEDEIKWLKNRFKSLRHQNTWKPSDEQMETLWSATEKYLESDNENVRKLIGEVLESLYENLKKLREDKL
jgi:hypothetical protein